MEIGNGDRQSAVWLPCPLRLIMIMVKVTWCEQGCNHRSIFVLCTLLQLSVYLPIYVIVRGIQYGNLTVHKN